MAERFFYIRGTATNELEVFTRGLITILTTNVPTTMWRMPQTQNHYVNFRNGLGDERIANHIQRRMMGHTIALLENDFPYDGIMPFGGAPQHSGGSLEHYCLWSVDGNLLVPENVDKILGINFPNTPALVFMHEDTKDRSVKTIEHAHIVVDTMNENIQLEQRFFETEDFAS